MVVTKSAVYLFGAVITRVVFLLWPGPPLLIFIYFTQGTIELGAQEAWPINVLPRWLKVTWYNIK